MKTEDENKQQNHYMCVFPGTCVYPGHTWFPCHIKSTETMYLKMHFRYKPLVCRGVPASLINSNAYNLFYYLNKDYKFMSTNNNFNSFKTDHLWSEWVPIEQFQLPHISMASTKGEILVMSKKYIWIINFVHCRVFSQVVCLNMHTWVERPPGSLMYFMYFNEKRWRERGGDICT